MKLKKSPQDESRHKSAKSSASQNKVQKDPSSAVGIDETDLDTPAESESETEAQEDVNQEADCSQEEQVPWRQYQELSENHLRLMAEYENYRRRSAREKEEIYTHSVADVVAKWLPILDNLDRASQAIEASSSEEALNLQKGLALVLEQAQKAMQDLDVVEIEALGQAFDPNQHEAVMHVEDEQAGENEVVEVFQKGYRRGEKILRHAVVKVAN